MQVERYQHKDCLNFRNGFCTFFQRPVSPQGYACINFIPAQSRQNEHNVAKEVKKDQPLRDNLFLSRLNMPEKIQPIKRTVIGPAFSKDLPPLWLYQTRTKRRRTRGRGYGRAKRGGWWGRP